jgi:lysylphosphatidylglycerol synthetase-like protein (DUF2156 family)
MLPLLMPLVRGTAFGTMLLGGALGGYTLLGRTSQPPPLVLTLVGCAILLIVLGVGLLRRSRIAWAFAVAVLAVLLVAGLLSVPAVVRSGFSRIAAGLLLAVIVGLLGSLIMNREVYT